MRRFAAAVLAAALLAGPAVAAEDDAADIALWASVRDTRDVRELDAYLATFPQGHFVALARMRAAALRRQAPGSPAAVPAAVAQGGAPAAAWVRPAQGQVRAIDGVLVDVDASALRASSNLRLAVVPAGAPDAVPDALLFADASTPIQASRLHLTLPGGPPGADEVRLYHIPPLAAAFQVAARAPVQVAPGVPGAVLVRDLAREARQLGPLQFEANHRDQPLLVQAQFLRVRPETELDAHWLGPLGLVEIPSQVAALSVGTLGQVAGAGEAVCVLAVDAGAALARVAALRPGAPVLLRGVPTSWDSAGPDDPVLLKDCALAR